MINNLEKYLSISICLFAVASFLSIAATNVFLGISVLLFLIILYKDRGFSVNEGMLPYFKAIGIFEGTLLVSALCSGDILQGLKTWGDFFIWRFMPFLILVFVFDTKEAVKKVYYTILGAFLVDALYVIYQGVFVYKLNINWARPHGFTGHPMTFAGFLCILVPILLVLVFESKILEKYSKVALPAFIIGSTALVLNSTRGAWLAVGIIVGLICLLYMFKSKSVFVACISLLLVGGLFLTNNQAFIKRVNTFNSIQSATQDPRFKIWNVSVELFKEYPVLGVGLGQFKSEYQENYSKVHPVNAKQKKLAAEYKKYLDNRKAKKLTPIQKKMSKAKRMELRNAYIAQQKYESVGRLTHAHNNFLQMLAENGVVGFVGYVFAFGYILWHNIKNYFTNKNPYALMIVGSTGALVLQGLTEYNFGNGAVMKLYWLVLGCLVVLAAYYNKKREDAKRAEQAVWD